MIAVQKSPLEKKLVGKELIKPSIAEKTPLVNMWILKNR